MSHVVSFLGSSIPDLPFRDLRLLSERPDKENLRGYLAKLFELPSAVLDDIESSEIAVGRVLKDLLSGRRDPTRAKLHHLKGCFEVDRFHMSNQELLDLGAMIEKAISECPAKYLLGDMIDVEVFPHNKLSKKR